MKTGYIKIEYGKYEKPNVEVQMVNDTVWMTVNEIARLFDVFTSAVNSNLRVMFQKGILRENEVCCTYSYTNKQGVRIQRELYNLKAVIAISYRVYSANVVVFSSTFLN